MRRLRLAMLLLASGCAPEIPDATFVCDTTGDCPPGQACDDGVCRRDTTCEPQDCAALRAECGTIDDGCGTPIQCGECEAPSTCGARIANICDCVPTFCEEEQCGAVDDGCGRLMDCGVCDAGQECVAGECACTPASCEGRCGMLPDGCGSIVDCGGCPIGETCGAGGPPLSGPGTCTPTTCVLAGAECGSISDGCGAILGCGDCTGAERCGGGSPGVPNQCGCTPQTCAELGAECGTVTDQCGTSLTCGGCTSPATCGGGGTPNRCGCAPPTCGPDQCGTITTPCGTASCGGCGAGRTCVANACACTMDFAEPNDTRTTAHDVPDALLSGSALLYTSFNVHVRGDEDWFRFSVPASAGLDAAWQIDVSLRMIPSGDDYDLEAFPVCAGGFAPPIACSRLGIAGGCRSANPGSADEQLTMTVTCTLMHVLVRVVPNVAAGACAPYQLGIGAQSGIDG